MVLSEGFYAGLMRVGLVGGFFQRAFALNTRNPTDFSRISHGDARQSRALLRVLKHPAFPRIPCGAGRRDTATESNNQTPFRLMYAEETADLIYCNYSAPYLKYKRLNWSVGIDKLAQRARTQMTHRFPTDYTQIPCGAGRRDTAAVIEDNELSIRLVIAQYKQ